MARTGLHDRYLAVLRELSGHAGNGRMRDVLGWQEGTYTRVSSDLRKAGLISAGRGRGGSVFLVEPRDAERPINGSEFVALRAETKSRLKPAVNGDATTTRSEKTLMSEQSTQQALVFPRDEITVPISRPHDRKLTQQQLEAHLWGAANILRGKTAGQDYKNYILSLMFYKRLCDQWECEADDAIAELERQQGRSFTEHQKAIFRRRGEHRFNIPDGSRWGDVMAESTSIGGVLTDAMKAVAKSNEELRGVFTVDWSQPAPDGSGKPLIANEVVHALIQHFNQYDLSNRSVLPDVLGRAYEYLIKRFADDAGAKAGEFFTPPEVVDTLVRILEPHPGDTVYDPTAGSGGMLVHTADYLCERGHQASSASYFAQEMNWGNAAIAKINSVLHGLEADIKAGASTITDPQFLENGQLRRFSLVLANFPFSDEFWWLKPQQQTDDKVKRDKLKKEIFGKEGYKDQFGRFGRGTGFKAPPASFGDYAFILHILASLVGDGRAGIVCPQGVLFRGQPEIEEETGEFDEDGNPKLKRRKADDEHLIRKALIDARLIDAVISLPLNVFYGAGIPACLLILRRQRPPERRDKVLLIYAARHYRQLSAKNELRPQDVMRMLVHYHAYGDAEKAPALVAEHSGRIRRQIDFREDEEVGRLEAEYQTHADALAALEIQVLVVKSRRDAADTQRERRGVETAMVKLEKARERLVSKLTERDERIDDARRRAEDDRRDVQAAGDELVGIYTDPDELLKHARVVGLDEIEENEFNLNIPRFIDTFEPEPRIEVIEALNVFENAQNAAASAEAELRAVLMSVGYAAG
jgi:type I restriction enzyme M protein